MKKLINWIKDWYYLNFQLDSKKTVWWIKNATLGELVDKIGSHIFHAGVCYRIDKWHINLCGAAELEKGGWVYNPYKGKYTEAKSVEFEWSEENGIKYVCSVIITDDLGYLIYDSEEEDF